MTYTIDYDGPSTAMVERPNSEVSNGEIAKRDKRVGFAVPSIVKTAATFLTGAAFFFGAEAYAPDGFRPSDLMGTYEGRITSAVKAAELEQQGKFDAWAGQVKVSVDQQVEQYRNQNQLTLAHYQAAMERAKIFVDATTRIQGQYVAYRMQQTQSQQATDIAVINWARLFGRIANGLEDGAGDAALNYSRNLGNELSTELTDAANGGATISVNGWDTGLPTIDDAQREIQRLKPITIPSPPKFESTTRTGKR